MEGQGWVGILRAVGVFCIKILLCWDVVRGGLCAWDLSCRFNHHGYAMVVMVLVVRLMVGESILHRMVGRVGRVEVRHVVV